MFKSRSIESVMKKSLILVDKPIFYSFLSEPVSGFFLCHVFLLLFLAIMPIAVYFSLLTQIDAIFSNNA